MNNNTNQNLVQNGQLQQSQLIQTNQIQPQVQVVQNNQPQQVDFKSLSPLEKQQLIERAIREAELKCKIEKPKAWNGLIFICILLVILCIASVVVLNMFN